MELDEVERDLCNGRKVGEGDLPARKSSDFSEAVTKDQNNSTKVGNNVWSEL
jgi:hypothetical protein